MAFILVSTPSVISGPEYHSHCGSKLQ